MPPRFAYWTILVDGKPTAFRARDRDELLPTVGQLKRKNDDVQLRWFARGRLWESQEAEHADFRRKKAHGDRERRGADWRPGGTHRDPRQHFRDEKKQRNQERRAERHRAKTSAERRDTRPFMPGGKKPVGGAPRKPWKNKPRGDRPWSGQPRKDRPSSDRSREGGRKPWAGQPRENRAWSKPRDNRGGARGFAGGHAPQRFGGERRKQSPREERPERREAETPPKRVESPDRPPAPEQITTKPEPPERG